MPSDESIALLATLLPLGGLFLLWGYCNFRNGWSEGFHSGLQVTPVTLEPTHGMPDHRMRVIEKIFPIPPRNEDSVIIFYDLESKQFEVDESGSINLSAVSCSICLEDFDAKAQILKGRCEHFFHRHCILNWVKVDHSNCPNCRANMWDQEEFDRLLNQSQSELKAQGIHEI